MLTFDSIIMVFPFIFSIVLLISANYLFFKKEDLFKLVRSNGGLDKSTEFGRDFNTFFTFIRLFLIMAFVDLLLLPAYIALIFSLAILVYPTYILVKHVPR